MAKNISFTENLYKNSGFSKSKMLALEKQKLFKHFKEIMKSLNFSVAITNKPTIKKHSSCYSHLFDIIKINDRYDYSDIIPDIFEKLEENNFITQITASPYYILNHWSNTDIQFKIREDYSSCGTKSITIHLDIFI